MVAFSVADNGDGTGATVTVSDAAGVVNSAWYAGYGDVQFTLGNFRIGNGTLALSLVPGIYAVYLVSYDGASDTYVPPQPVRVTNGTAQGPLNEPAEILRAMVSESAAFIAACGVATPTEALGRIYKTWARKDEGGLPPMPFAVVQIPKGFAWQSVSGGYGNFLLPDGKLQLELVTEATSDYQADAQVVERLVGNVLQDLIDAAGIDTNLPITSISLPEGVWRTAPEQDGGREPFWATQVMIAYGNGGEG